MSAAQHTPGPWEAVEWNCGAATTIKAGDIVVAECSGFGRYADESIADARLIAAAPEMRELLQLLIRAADGRVLTGNLILDHNNPLIIAARELVANVDGVAS